MSFWDSASTDDYFQDDSFDTGSSGNAFDNFNADEVLGNVDFSNGDTGWNPDENAGSNAFANVESTGDYQDFFAPQESAWSNSLDSVFDNFDSGGNSQSLFDNAEESSYGGAGSGGSFGDITEDPYMQMLAAGNDSPYMEGIAGASNDEYTRMLSGGDSGGGGDWKDKLLNFATSRKGMGLIGGLLSGGMKAYGQQKMASDQRKFLKEQAAARREHQLKVMKLRAELRGHRGSRRRGHRGRRRRGGRGGGGGGAAAPATQQVLSTRHAQHRVDWSKKR